MEVPVIQSRTRYYSSRNPGHVTLLLLLLLLSSSSSSHKDYTSTSFIIRFHLIDVFPLTELSPQMKYVTSVCLIIISLPSILRLI
jgi:hypothetical protein